MNQYVEGFLGLLCVLLLLCFFSGAIVEGFILAGFLALVASPILFLITKDITTAITFGLSGLFALVPTLILFRMRRTGAAKKNG